MDDLPAIEPLYPSSADHLGAEWYTAVLRASATIDAGTEVASVRSEQIGVGVGVLGLLWRVHLTYRGGQGPTAAVLKLPHPMAESRNLAAAFRFYQREIGFYTEAAGRSPLRNPAVYGAWCDQATGDFVLLMEDLSDRRMHDQLAGCPPDDAAVDLTALASHHAAWWSSPSLAGLQWAVRLQDPPNPQALVPALRRSWPIIESHFAHLLKGPMAQAAKRMPDAVVPLMERLGEPPLTLLHGDHRLDNLFFADDPAEPVSAIDWQISGQGRGCYDVAYFLSQSLLPEERRANGEALVRGYHDALVAGGVTGYSLSQCWDDYRLATLFVSVYPLNAGSVDLVNERAVELFSAMLERSVAAIVDLDALEFMT